MTEPRVVRFLRADLAVTCPVIFHDELRWGNSARSVSADLWYVNSISPEEPSLSGYPDTWGWEYMTVPGKLCPSGDR